MSTQNEVLPTFPSREWGLSPFTEQSNLFSPTDFLTASPYQVTRRMQEEMDRMWSRFAMGPQAQSSAWEPRVDISEEPEQWKVEADLPGVDKENISVDVRENQLIIKAEMKQEHTDEKPQYYRRERRYGSFERRLALPGGIKEEAIASSFKDGVLTVSIPKTEQAQNAGRRIPIK